MSILSSREGGRGPAVEAALRRLLDQTEIGVWETAGNPVDVQISERCASILGFAPGTQVVSRADWDAHIHPDDRQRVREALHDAIAAEKAHDVEYRVLGDGAQVR